MTLFVMSFFYNLIGDNMTVYIDGVFLLNFFFDFILLLSVSVILKRNVKIINIILGGVVGSASTFLLFLSINSIELFLYKIIISVLMIITSFGYRNIKYTFRNLIYLYLFSIILGGFLYIVNDSFNFNNGLVIYNAGMSLNIFIIIILTPILAYFNIKNIRNIKNKYNLYYNVVIYINNSIINTTAYLDTGNTLVSPYTSRPVILLKNKSPAFNDLKYTIIPYNTIENRGYIKGYKPDKVYIEGMGEYHKIVIGLIDNNICMDGVDCILNNKLLEEK